MNRRAIRPLLSLMFVSSMMPAAADAQQPPSADEQAIRSLEEQGRVAVLNGDIAAMERLWSERFIVNNPRGQVTPDRNGVIDLVKRGVIRYSQFERVIEAIRIDGDVVIVMGTEKVVPASAAAGQAVHRRYTNVWKRSGATWQAIARHASVATDK